ncbi:YicC family protein [Anaerobacillus alkalilacustris]|uniref:YicC family protein n=1 Tax=Anaerobacillus alkalilacustris TaxID=393763 RepID=A0A1S2LLK8_9BACI|nr:YicC/YloC family endoribonuclease [Anaerobacillus alkalilacustris]OIJ13224.1 YicC family protein [Anaerobacillus alkalilacustris]
MIVSMTGYGQAFIEKENYRINVEMKSVNHRFSEVTIRMPRQFLFLEDRLKKQVNQFVQRGKVDVFLTIEGDGLVQRTLQVDWNLIADFHEVFETAEKKLGFKQDFNLEKIIIHPDVVTVIEKENQSDTLVDDIITTCEKAVLELLKMRQKEGESLCNDLKSRLEKLHNLTDDVATSAPKVIETYHERLLKRVDEFLTGKLEIEEARILTEVAIYADKANVDEELIRLKSHLDQFLFIIEQNKGIAVGRKLDFLVQEMNREANTIGSKSNDIHINKQVVELKAELEKIKEQVQNIE